MDIIVDDGGPSSAKTTGLVAKRERAESIGRVAVIVPEAATILMPNGITPANMGNKEFQCALLEYQIQNEKFFSTHAAEIARKQGKEPLILCDRGLLSGAAYYSSDPDNLLHPFQDDILSSQGLSVEDVISRYKGVIHMVTAADGAEEFYTTLNNRARTETPEEARILDKKTQSVWLGHPKLRIVSNRDKQGNQITLHEKINRAIAEMLGMLGYPIPIEDEQTFILREFDISVLPPTTQAIDIEQTYLLTDNDDVEERVRKRTYLGGSSYVHTIKKPTPALDGSRYETECPISLLEYQAFLLRRDLTRHTVKKTRYCFIWKDQYFELDVFKGRLLGRYKLERERTDRNDSTILPDFLKIEREVTGEKAYSNRELACI